VNQPDLIIQGNLLSSNDHSMDEFNHHPAQIRYHESRLENIGLVELGLLRQQNYTEKISPRQLQSSIFKRAIFQASAKDRNHSRGDVRLGDLLTQKPTKDGKIPFAPFPWAAYI
jgi:hypothetical protein